MTADDDDIDDASLKSMRAVWLSMRDEDPPAAGMSGLLAAAREKADAMRAQPTWWQRLFTQLRRPPALAFATVMLLVGGAVLVTRNVDDKVESETAAVAPSEELRVRESTGHAYNRDQEAPTVVAPPPPATPITESHDPAPEQLSGTRRPKKDVTTAGPKGGGKQQRAGKQKTEEDVGPHEPSRHDRFDGDAESTYAEGTDTSGTTVLESPGRVEPARPKPAGEQVTLTDDVKAAPPPSEQLARQAESAATRGDCPAVRTIVAKLRQQDEAVYKTRLAKNAAVTKCL